MNDMDFDDYWPTFSTEKTSYGDRYFVHWRGRKWGLLTPIMDNWQFDQWPTGIYERRGTKVELSFKMLLLDEENPERKL